MTIRDYLKQWKQQRVLRKLIAQASKAPPAMVKLRKRHFQYLLVNIDDTEAEGFPEKIARVVETIVAHNAAVSIDNSFLVITLGVPVVEMDSLELRLKLVSSLIAEHGSSLRIVHGQCDGMAGFYGGERRGIYGAIIPQFNARLKTLVESDFGAAIEIAEVCSSA